MKHIWLLSVLAPVSLLALEKDDVSLNPYLLYIWGSYNVHEKNHTISKKCFDTLITDNAPAHVYPGYIDYLFLSKQYKKIADLIHKVDTQLKDNLEIQLIFVKALELVGKHKEAEQKIIALLDSFNTHPEVVYGATLAHMRNKKSDQAVEVIDHYLKSTIEKPTHFIFYYLKAQIAAQNNNIELSRQCLSKCLTLNPSFDQGWLLSGLLYELEGNLEQAIAGYRNFLHIVGHDSAIEQQLLNLTIRQKQAGGQQEQLKKLFEESLVLYHQRQYSLALHRIEKCLAINPTYKQARLLKIELLCALAQPNEAIALLEQWITKEPKELLWYRAAHLLYQAHVERETIIALFERLEQKSGTSLLANLYVTDMYLKDKSLDKATKSLKKGLSLARDVALKTKIAYQLASIYFDTKDYTALKQILDYALALKANFAPLLNLAAYFYASKEKQFDKAQKLIEQALANNKDNVHYLDTQAIIWYKQGKLHQAATLLTWLAQKAPHDFHIQKHCAKALFAQGKKNLATNTLQKALNGNCNEQQKEKCISLMRTWKQ
ncbi:MAG: tetratricopeptide repeat protein [Candidatus Babeliales bacterium]